MGDHEWENRYDYSWNWSVAHFVLATECFSNCLPFMKRRDPDEMEDDDVPG